MQRKILERMIRHALQSFRAIPIAPKLWQDVDDERAFSVLLAHAANRDIAYPFTNVSKSEADDACEQRILNLGSNS